jgi:SAM-dependent methyltransferase
MDDRKLREKQAQDIRFGRHGGSRGTADLAYWITTESDTRFRKRLIDGAQGKRILDIGSGAGGNVIALCSNGASVTGVDISDAAIELAKARMPEELRGHATFLAMDAENLDFPDGSFDVVTGKGILHHLALRRAYAEIARVLSPDGYALFSEPLGYNPLINLYRRLTPNQRTADEHPLLSGDLDLAREFFARVHVQYFYLTALFALPLGPNRIGRGVLKYLNALDRALFRMVPALRRYAWFVLIALSEPVKRVSAER